MRRFFIIVLAVFAMSFMGHNVSAQDADSIAIEIDSILATVDSIVADSVPEWYVAPEIPLSLRAPRRAPMAAKCPVDSIMTFNIDSVLVETTCYEYDNTGRTINQEVWSYTDAGRIGSSKNEYCYDASGNQTCTAVYAWDAATHNWAGTERFEYAYKTFAGQKKLTSSTTFIWLNGAWVADERYTYNYDAAAREIEYYEYRRNTSTNQLEYYKGRVQAWIDDTQLSLEELYTTYSNGAWNGGTKKEWAYDAAGNPTLYAYYSTITNGNWVGSSKETWEYGGLDGQLTKYEKFGWYNNDWSMTKREIADFDAEGRQILVENYTGANGVPTGTKKEEYTFDANGINTMTVKYAWSNGDWVGSEKETWAYEGPNGELTLHEKYGWASSDWSKTLKEETEYSGAKIIRIENYTYANGVQTGTKKEIWTYGGPSGQLTLHEQFGWASSDWSKTLKEETEYSGANVIRIENYTYANGVPTGTKKELTTYTSGKKTQILTFAWENGDWVNSNRETWEFNGPSSKQTKHEKCEWENGAWTIMVQENTTYNSNTTIVENYERIEGVLTGTKKESNTVVSGKPTETIIYDWNGSWVESTKENWAYTNGKLTKHEFYEWTGDWTKTLEENTTYSGANITLVENYERIEGVWTGTQKEEYAYTSGKKTQTIAYHWNEGTWVEYSKEVWNFNTSDKQTLHELYGWGGSWVIVLRENTTYEGANITLIENYALVEGVWKGTKKEEYTYVSGENTKTITYTWSDGWVYATKYEAGYQDGNITISATNYTWNGTSWVGTGNRIQTTTVNGKETEKLTQNWPSGATEWTNASITTNTYNADGVNILTYNGTWNGSRWVVSSMRRTDIIKDAAGRQVLNASWVCSSDSVWRGIQKDTTSYSATNKELYRASYTSWLNNKWVLSYKVEHRYDGADRLILEQRYDWKNGKEQGRYKYEHEYDAQGREIMNASYLDWSTTRNDWIGTSKSEYEYDSNGRKSKEISYTWGSGDWTYYRLYDYQYDAAGREILQIVQRYSNNAWVYSNKYEKEYSGSTLVKDNVYRWSTNKWQLYTQSESYYDDDAQAKLRHVINGSWNTRGVLQSYTDKLYSYACDPRTIRFVNYDGTLLETQTLDKGLTPSYSGATPTRESNAEYTYTFAGWAPAIVPVTGNATYTATFTATKNQYTITWLDEAGNEIDQTTVEYGIMPTHANPTKENTAEYTYNFKGWKPGIGIVTGDATYTADFDSIKNKYTITWVDDNDVQLDQMTIEYGVMPEHADAEKAATAEWTYSFTGWTPAIVFVTGNATYKATFSQTKNTYTVTWLNEDDKEIEHETLEYGVTPEHAAPIKENTAEWTYTFTGWDPAIESVKGDASYKATFSQTKNKYVITFLNYDGTELQSGEVEYGVTPEFTGATPTKPADAQGTYTFNGWDEELAAVTGTKTYTAQFISTANKYTIIFQNYDGTELQRSEVEYGELPNYEGEDPTKPADVQDTYNFAGWDPQVVAVTGNATYTAQYTSTVNSYTIKFMNGSEELQSTEVAYGEMPVYEGATPTKDATAQYTYDFSGWDSEIVAVTGAKTYNAQFTGTVNNYVITFMNGEEILQSGEVAYGETPEYTGATPTKPADAQDTYTFAGWSPEIAAVTGTATYTATFTGTTNKYLITFKNGETELQSSEVDYGETPSYTGATPTKPADAQYTYTFSGWDPAIVAVTGIATYEAQFSSTVNKYTIKFMNDETELQSSEVEYGTEPVYEGATPTKDATPQYTYAFSGWDSEIESVTGTKTYTATFSQTTNKYTITFMNGTDILQTGEVEYGETPVYTAVTPTKDATAQYTYTFTGWDKEIASVTGDETYTAQFSSEVNKYVITFLNYDGTELQTGDVEYGVVPTYTSAIPTKPADAQGTYTFAGWDEEIAAVTGAKTYTATFTGVKGTYTITFYFGDGVTILSQMELAYGEMPEMTLEPARLADPEFSYTFAGWEPAIAPVTADADYVAVYTATTNSYTIIFRNDDGTELQRDVLEYGILPIYAGEEPTKEEDERYTYEFAGWKPAVDIAKADAVYTATYTATKKRKQDIYDIEAGTSATKIYIEGNIYILRAGHAYAPDGTKLY